MNSLIPWYYTSVFVRTCVCKLRPFAHTIITNHGLVQIWWSTARPRRRPTAAGTGPCTSRPQTSWARRSGSLRGVTMRSLKKNYFSANDPASVWRDLQHILVTRVHPPSVKRILNWLTTLTPSTADVKDNYSHLPYAHPHIHTKRTSSPHSLPSDPLPTLKICEEDVCLLCQGRNTGGSRTVCPPCIWDSVLTYCPLPPIIFTLVFNRSPPSSCRHDVCCH